jgi:hypothetical protein
MSYQDDYLAAHVAKQATITPTSSAATVKAAELLHYQRLYIAGKKWGVSNNAHQAILNLGGRVPSPTEVL